MQAKPRVLISGAGVAGLTCAIWLGRAGFRPTIVERANDVRADGYIVSLSNKSYSFAVELGLLDTLRAAAAGIKESAYHHRSGRAMLELDYQALFRGVDIIQIMRDDLQRVLYDAACADADFKFSDSIAKLTNSNDGVDVSFESGTSERYDLVIGADGLHSNTRSLAWPEQEIQKQYLGLFSAAYRLPNVLGLRDRFENHMEQNRYMCVYTTRAGDLACVFIWQRDDHEAPDPRRRRELLLKDYTGAPRAAQQVLEQCPDGLFYMDPLIQIDLASWSNKRVVLLGDAAHCMTLLSGQGASAAFWGASELCKALATQSIGDAFAHYQRALQPTIAVKQPATLNAARWYIPGSPFRYKTRDALMTCLPDLFFQHYFRKKYTSA
ncbi:MAG: FAD-dependent monooxygenase [Pseudomonadota bacterium]